MKSYISLLNSAYLLCFPAINGFNKALLIISNTAGYFADHGEFGTASPRIDAFCTDLSERYNIYYLVQPGQDPNFPDAKYSYTNSVQATKEALQLVSKEHLIVGVMGMCTGGAIAAEAMESLGLSSLPLILYNTSSSVGWNIPSVQEKFKEKYGREYGKAVLLDCEELARNAPPELTPIIDRHTGRMLQIASGHSDYRIERQRKLATLIPRMRKVEFLTMSDSPIQESEEYWPMIELIFEFLAN